MNRPRRGARVFDVTLQTTGAGEVCRLIVCGPESRIELAVPAHIPLADLLPTLLTHLDQRLATTGLERGGWVLQRLGEDALDEDLSTAALGLYDGDVVHLRPRDSQLPPAAFDDLADGLATSVQKRVGEWRPPYTRRLSLGAVALALLVGLIAVPLVDSGLAAARSAGFVAVVLIIAAATTSRQQRDLGTAAILEVGAVVYAMAAGLTLAVGSQPISASVMITGKVVALGIGFVVLAVVVGSLATRRLTSVYAGVGLACLPAAVGALLHLSAGLSAQEATAVTVPVTVLLGFYAPGVAALLAGFRVAALPMTPQEFQADVEPEPGARLMQRAAAADGFLLAFYASLGALTSGCLILLAMMPGLVAQILVAVVAVLVLLHCRELTNAFHRLAMMAPAVSGGVALAWHESASGSPMVARLVVALAAGFALLAAVGARVLPRRRLIPIWGMTGDIAHWLAAVAVIPLALSVAGIYSFAHGLFS